jgi:hypothetical protein
LTSALFPINTTRSKVSIIVTIGIKMCGGMTEEEKEKKAANDAIESKIKKEKIALAKEIKMLLLGLLSY